MSKQLSVQADEPILLWGLFGTILLFNIVGVIPSEGLWSADPGACVQHNV